MLRSARKIEGLKLNATDGEIGKVRDLYFDDQSWTARYLVIDLGNWLPRQQVLLSPAAIGQAQWDEHTLKVQLTREQIRNSPDVSTDIPVSRQHEEELAQYYGWPMYWTGPVYTGVEPLAVMPPAEQIHDDQAPRGDPHLRSFREVGGYHMRARDGELGRVEDLLVDDGWTIRYIEASTRNWLPGRRVLLPPQWAREVLWSSRVVRIDLTVEEIKSLPQYDPAMPYIEYEQRLRQWRESHKLALNEAVK